MNHTENDDDVSKLFEFLSKSFSFHQIYESEVHSVFVVKKNEMIMRLAQITNNNNNNTNKVKLLHSMITILLLLLLMLSSGDGDDDSNLLFHHHTHLSCNNSFI